MGLSARKLIQTLTYRSLVLFKLFLLERKVLFFQSPVLDLCTFFLTLLSLHPGMLEQGLNESACSVPLDTPPDSLSPEIEERPISVAGSVKSIDEESANSADKDIEVSRLPSLTHTGNITNEEVGLPLRVFGRGNLCHPYLSLSFIDTLSQPCVRGYMIGATNMLFKQKKGVAEVIVDIGKREALKIWNRFLKNTGCFSRPRSIIFIFSFSFTEKDKIDILDPDLKRALQLTTEDLRFTDYLVKQACFETGSDIFLGKKSRGKNS